MLCDEVPAGILAIDTSTGHAGIALSTDSTVLTRSWPADRAQTTTVLPEIDALVHEAEMVPADVHAVVVATGPGTFTGLRVGLAIAKGLVAARGIPLVGIPTLDVVLAAHDEEAVVAVLPAGRGRVVWQPRGEQPRNTTVDEMIGALAHQPGRVLVGEVQEGQQEQIAAALAQVRWEYRDPAVLLQLGAARLAASDVDDAVTLEPTYLHGVTVNAPVIEDRLKKR